MNNSLGYRLVMGLRWSFIHNVAEPAQCALEIAEALRKHPEIRVRMGIPADPFAK